MTLSLVVQELLAEMGKGKEHYNRLIQVLRSGQYGDPLPLLLPYLHDPDPYRSSIVLNALMRIDHARSLPFVLPLLNDPDWQYTICRWVASLGGAEAIEPIIRVLHFGVDPGSRVMAVGALARIGDERAIVALESALHHDDELDSGGHSVSSVALDAIATIRSRMQSTAND